MQLVHTELPTPAPLATDPLGARERLELLFDAGTFVELGAEVLHRSTDACLSQKHPRGDGVVTGFGAIGGKRVYVYSQDRSAFGGALGRSHGAKIAAVQDKALKDRAPIVCINDSGGARIQEGVDALAGYGEIFRRHVAASGRIPQIAVVAGACAGGAAYGPSLCDLVIMVKDSTLFLTGPKVVQAVCQEQVTAKELGGADVHGRKTGLAHFVFKNEADAFRQVQRLLDFFQNPQLPARPAGNNHPGQFVPANDRKVYDVRALIEAVVDRETFMEVQENHAANITIGFARINGMAIGIVANNPRKLGGVLDAAASRKAARFVRLCDRFGLPLVTFVDVPGFLPGSAQEHANVIGNGSKLLYAYCESSVPKISIVTRKSYGGAYIVMSSKAIGGDFCFAWPQAQIAVIGKQGAAQILHGKQIATADDPATLQAEKEAEYEREMLPAQRAAEQGHIDAIISPGDTRRVIMNCLVGYAPERSDCSKGNVQL